MQNLIKMAPDAMIFAGGTAVALGAGILNIAAGFIVGGILAIAGGVAAMKSPKAAE